MHRLYWIFIIILYTASGFFIVKNIEFKRKLGHQAPVLGINSGVETKVQRIIDGDEISVLYKNKPLVVRILGIKAFNPSVNDPHLTNVARYAFLYLKRSLTHKTIRLDFKKLKYDDQKRLLAYVFLGTKDIGRDMISKGFVMVYTKYPFSKNVDYLIVEDQARRQGKGLWASKRSRRRAIQLKALWQKK